MSRYAARRDRGLLLGSGVSILLAGAVAAAVLGFRASLPEGAATERAVLGAVPVFLLLGLVLTVALAPRGYRLRPAAVEVERPLSPVKIPVGQIRAAGLVPEGGLGRCMRLFGVGGAFGYYGRYWSSRIGSFRLYATSRRGLVHVVTQGGSFVLSPEQPERFLDELRGLAPSVVEPAAFEPGPRAWRPTRHVPLALAVVLVLLIGGAMAGSWVFAPCSVRVDDGAVVIERRHGSEARIPLASIARVRLLTRADFPGWRRVSGVALGPVNYGHFRSRLLGAFELYAWRTGPYVLLETTRGRVVITPDDPESFVTEVRSLLEPTGTGGAG